MKNLTKQQIIILSITVIVALYGIYDRIIVPRTKSVSLEKKKKSTELETFISDITAKITKGPITAADNRAINLAETNWKQDPFLDQKSFHEWIKFNKPDAGDISKSEPVFGYSGYISMGRKKMAIINGIEYESGEPLDLEGYILEKIYPEKAVIVNKNNLSRIEVSLQE